MSASGNYSVSTPDANGCTGTSSITITENTSPVVTFNGLNPGYCLANPPSALMGNPAGGVFTGAGVIGNTFDPSLAGTGTHTVAYSYTDANGCGGSDLQSTLVSNNAFVSLGADTIICDDASFVIAPGTYSDYEWQDNSTGSTYAVSGPMLGVGTHVIYVQVTDVNGCEATDSVTVVISDCTGMTDVTDHAFIISPNPANGLVNMQFMGFSDKIVIEVINPQGQIVDRRLEIIAGQNRLEMDLSSLASGIYFIRIDDGEKLVMKKLILD